MPVAAGPAKEAVGVAVVRVGPVDLAAQARQVPLVMARAAGRGPHKTARRPKARHGL